MGEYANKNKGYRWILTAIEILSRYAFAIPVYRKDVKNMTEAVKELLKKFKKRFGKYPIVVQFDEGKEFYNVGVRELLKNYNVDYFSTKSRKKAAIVERFNRTLKTAMWKYFYSKGTYDWISVLDELVENYNGTKHTTIHMKPKNVNRKNENEVWITLFGSNFGELPLPKFRIGDTVRVSKYKNVFKNHRKIMQPVKQYQPTFHIMYAFFSMLLIWSHRVTGNAMTWVHGRTIKCRVLI